MNNHFKRLRGLRTLLAFKFIIRLKRAVASVSLVFEKAAEISVILFMKYLIRLLFSSMHFLETLRQSSNYPYASNASC